AICGGGAQPGQFLSATGSGTPGTLSQTNPATGASTSIGPVVTTGGLPLSLTGLAPTIASGATAATLYGSTGDNSPNNPRSLVTINPAQGQATVIGRFHTATNMGRAMADIVVAPPNSACAGTLLGVSSDDRRLYAIDPTTALVTPRGPTIPGANQGDGLTF